MSASQRFWGLADHPRGPWGIIELPSPIKFSICVPATSVWACRDIDQSEPSERDGMTSYTLLEFPDTTCSAWGLTCHRTNDHNPCSVAWPARP